MCQMAISIENHLGDIHNNIKCGINLNINRSCFKDSYMNLTQSSKEQFLYGCEQQYIESHDDVSFIFFYIVKNKLYSMSAICPE